MKKVALTGLLLCLLSHLHVQSQNITIRQGIELEYTIYPMGTVFPCTLRLDTSSAGSLVIDWKNVNGQGGKYIVTRAARDSASHAFWGPPQYNQEITLDADQTMLVLTQKNWNELQKTGRTNFDGTPYLKKEAAGNNQLSMEGKPVGALYLESENGEVRMWVLNNAALPILLKVERNPFGIDLQIERVKK